MVKNQNKLTDNHEGRRVAPYSQEFPKKSEGKEPIKMKIIMTE